MTLSRIGATTLAQMKMMFRRRIVLFWSLVFPIILMALLGLLFGRSIDAGTITVIDASHTQASAAMVRALSTTVLPPSAWIARITSHRLRRACGSRPVVGSSRNTTSGSCTSASAIASRCCWPPDMSSA